MTSVVLIKGEDPTLLSDAVRNAVEAALGDDDRSLALEDLGGDELTVGAVVDAATTPPFLTSRRVLVVRDVGRWSSEELAPLLEYLADPLETTSLVLVAGGGQTPQKLANAVKKAGEVIDAAAPRGGRDRTRWIIDRLKGSDLVFDAAAGNRVSEHLGEDLGRLSSIIETLLSTYGPGARIGPAEVEPFLGDAGALAPWDLTDAIDRGDTAAALAVLARLTGSGERHPMVVLASLHRHFGAMLRLDGADIQTEAAAAAAVGMAPYPAKKAMEQARRLGSANVARAIELIADADMDLRGMKDLPDELILEVLVPRLSRLAGGGRVRR